MELAAGSYLPTLSFLPSLKMLAPFPISFVFTESANVIADYARNSLTFWHFSSHLMLAWAQT